MSTMATLSSLKDPSLLPERAPEAPSFEVRNPADPDQIVGHVALQNQADTKKAIQRSAEVLPEWRDKTTAQHRSSLLQKWSQLIKENSEDIATIMTLESGKPLKEARGEVNYGLSFLDFYAGEAIRSSSAGGGFVAPTPFAKEDGSPRGQVMAIQQAVGVTGLITPWNFPIAMITRKAAPALAAGCTAVVKPSGLTPLTAMALHTLAIRAGIPENVFQLITTPDELASEVGEELCTNPTVKKISFTGSTAVGKLLMKLSSDTMKRLSLELGGNAPFIVFEDADIDKAVSAAMASKFRNAGQTCVCADRFLVHSSIHDEFVEKLAKQAQKIRVGPGIDEETVMSCLISEKAVASVATKVEDAIAKGSMCVTGGNRLLRMGSHFFEPTVLANVPLDSDIWQTETFGPVAPIRSFDTEEEALAVANDSSVGLAGYFCTKDLSRAFRFASSLECGLVGVNEGVISTCSAPFGGVKESGLGREGSSVGIAEYLEAKYVFVNF